MTGRKAREARLRRFGRGQRSDSECVSRGMLRSVLAGRGHRKEEMKLEGLREEDEREAGD